MPLVSIIFFIFVKQKVFFCEKISKLKQCKSILYKKKQMIDLRDLATTLLAPNFHKVPH